MASFKKASVEVNQRALIDNILARYSGEFLVFRELLQLSDDAGASSVKIRFETEEYLSREGDDDDTQADESDQEDLPDLKTAVVHQWTFMNNGTPFGDEDWTRLKKIADGNPDEEKIGATGVGFYSLFSVTEDPCISSGGKWMEFYWKGEKDQLSVLYGDIPASVDGVVDPWTTFQMTPREPGPIPAALDFTRFLASSITFMTHLSEVSVYFDNKQLVRLSKSRGVSKKVPMLRGLKGTSPNGMMDVKSIETTRGSGSMGYTVGMDKPSAIPKTDTPKTGSPHFLPLFDGIESINLLEAKSSNIVLTIFAANVDVRLDEKMTVEILRATKKDPPSRLRYELIYTGKGEYESSVSVEGGGAYDTGNAFQGLWTDLEGIGSTRVFIGHSTSQTTGFGGHIATQFIPTVERESIDLVDRNVAVWNKELLYVGGFLARSAYEFGLSAIKRLWERAAALNGPDGPDKEVQTMLRGRALHALQFFTFHSSTPSPTVSNLMETAFFACATTRPFSIISSSGVRNASQVYVLNPEFSSFIKHLPIISQDVADGAKTMIATLRSRGMIKNVTFVDVLNELRLRPLSETETITCLKWWISVTNQGNNSHHCHRESWQLLDTLVVSFTEPSKMMKMSDARMFLNFKTDGAIILADGPLLNTLVPASITRSFDQDVLASVFPWQPLSIADWLRYVTDPKVASANADFDVTQTARWAERVLTVLVQAWSHLAESAREDVIGILSPMPCIPTSTGLKVPNQAYFSSADSLNSFCDLPIVTMPSGAIVEGTLEKVLQSLGVRNHVELQIIFDRMVETGVWTTFDLVRYLVSIQAYMRPQEFERLRQASAFPKKKAGREQLAAGASWKVQRYKAEDLYEPNDLFRELGLPIIDWGTDNQWDPKSYNARFIYALGLRRAPPLREILRFAASDNPTVRTKALAFFLENVFPVNIYRNYNPQDFRDLAFVPAVLGSKKMLAKPSKVCIDSKWTTLGFATVDPMLPDGAAGKLRLNHRPPPSDLVTLLERSPPEDEATARQWFEILSDHVLEFSLDHLQRLSEMFFVPVDSTGDKVGFKRLRPIQCFLEKQRSEPYSNLFAFVDFGTRGNKFLEYCGTKQEPTIEDVARILLVDPRRAYELVNGRENYLSELSNLASNMRLLTEETINRMTQSKMFLGSRRLKKDGGKASSEGDEDELLQPKEVVIVDDIAAYQVFGDRIFCAPQKDILKELYRFLGSPCLSSLVRKEYRTSDEVSNSTIGAEIRHLILERLPLFLHEHPQSSTTKVSLNWLKEEKNFIVKVFEKLSVINSLRHGDICDSKSFEDSAIARREGNGPIELWLAGNSQVDMYEISISLCHIILESPKLNDAPLFMLFLTTDLSVIEKWGYNVNRILRQQK